MSGLTRDAKTLAVDTEHVVFSALILAEACVKFVAILMVVSSLLMFLIVAGVALVALRKAFFWMLPFLTEHSNIIVAGLNIMIIVLNAFADAVIIAFDVVAGAVNTFGGDMPIVSPTDWGTVSIGAYTTAMKHIAVTCGPYTDVWSVWSLTAAPILSTHVCPYARVVYPVFGETLKFAEGFITVESDPTGNNCEVELPPSYATVCTGMSAGYIILELLVPFLLLCIFVYAAGHALFRLLWTASTLLLFVLIRTTDIVMNLLYGAESAVQSELEDTDDESDFASDTTSSMLQK